MTKQRGLTRTSFVGQKSRWFTRTNFAKQNLRGFTLIELLVVIAIIGILSSVVLASLTSARVKARDTRRVSDIKQIQIALELYYDAKGFYPASLGALVGSSEGASLPSLPADPSKPTVAVNGEGAYKYAVNASPATAYHVAATLEQSPGSTILDDADRDFVSSGLTPPWVTDATSSSVPFSGGETSTVVVYDVSNQ